MQDSLTWLLTGEDPGWSSQNASTVVDLQPRLLGRCHTVKYHPRPFFRSSPASRFSRLQ